MMNCSRNVPILLLERSMERSLKLGKPSGCMPSPHMRNWFPTMKDPDTLIATPSWPWARHWSISTTCTSLSEGQSPANVLRMLERVAKISFPPTDCFLEKLQNREVHISKTLEVSKMPLQVHRQHLLGYKKLLCTKLVSTKEWQFAELTHYFH